MTSTPAATPALRSVLCSTARPGISMVQKPLPFVRLLQSASNTPSPLPPPAPSPAAAVSVHTREQLTAHDAPAAPSASAALISNKPTNVSSPTIQAIAGVRLPAGSTPSPPVADPRASTTSRPISSDPTPPSKSQIRDDASAPALIHLRRRREQQPPSVRKIQPPHNVHGPPDAPSSTTRPHLLRQQHTAPPISVFPCQLRRRHNGPPRPIISDHNAHPSQIQAARQPVPQPISRTSHGQHNPATTWAIKIKQFKSIEHLQKATGSHA
ncbi:hypothetical protein ACLOJK_013564 [Asimina triloba]